MTGREMEEITEEAEKRVDGEAKDESKGS